ncbi:hypothetical protein NHP164001_14460 [Helicobacter trogontum]|uniref:Lipoprotein n=1 Tax=Helicobacter trogontum TaxID=50960 RepID=A0ABQ0D522_9HELI
MRFFAYVFFVVCVLSLTGCSINRQLIPLAKSKEIGFVSDGSFVLQDPPPGKARIYVYRENNHVGSYLGYTLRIEHQPKTDSKGRPNYKNYQDSLGYMAMGKTFLADVEAGYPIALMAKTEATSYILFTPMEGEIYCVKGSMRNGWTMPRPHLVLVDKKTCEEAWIDYFSNKNIEFQNQWRKVYNEKGDRIRLDTPTKARNTH